MTIATSIWDGIENAQIFDRGKYVKANFSGVIVVRSTIAKTTRAQGLAFIVEMEILETNMSEEHAVGSKATWFQKMSDKQVAFSAVLEWAAACIGVRANEKDRIESEVRPVIKELMDYATTNPTNNEFVGTKLRLDAVATKTKKDSDFTRYDFTPYVLPN